MNLVSISDLHISRPDDEAADLCRKFIHGPWMDNTSTVIFLGDIFDYCVGNHYAAIKYYNFFFEGIKKLILQGKDIYYIEGNHDFHLKELFNRYLAKEQLDSSKFHYLTELKEIQHQGLRVQLMHGDQLDHLNSAYKTWKSIYTSSYFKFFVDYVLNFYAIQALGRWASNDSKKRNSKQFNFDIAKKKFRDGYLSLNSKGVDYILAGHTHIQDEYKFEDNALYLNSGFPKTHKQFILINEKGHQFVSLM